MAIEDIRDATLRLKSDAKTCLLVLQTVGDKRRFLTPGQWKRAGRAAGESSDARDPASLLRSSVLLREFGRAGLEIRPSQKRYRGKWLDDQFGRLGSTAVRVALAISTLCIAYGFADWLVLSRQAYAQSPPIVWFALGGLTGGGNCALCLVRSAVPVLETVGVSLLLTCAVGAALWPAALRVNAYTAATSPQVCRYVLKANDTLWPKNTDAPALHTPIDAVFCRRKG